MKPKKVPMRMCVGCREMKPKRELLRILRSPSGVISIDTTSKAAGRGAYICSNFTCLERAVKTRALDRALEQKINETILTQLKEAIAGANE